MESKYTFNKNSWHCRCAQLSGSMKWKIMNGRQIDICEYIRAVITGMIGIGLLSIIAGFVLAVLVFMASGLLAWYAYMCIHMELIEPSPEAFVAILFICALSIFKIIECCFEWYSNKTFDRTTNLFHNAVWEKFKNKQCFKISFK